MGRGDPMTDIAGGGIGPAYEDKAARPGGPIRPRAQAGRLREARARAAGQSILFEGAQGTLLDIDHGTYPFVTSSNTTAGGLCTGSGVAPTKIGGGIGGAKAYITRAGAGPFPTELFGDEGQQIRDRGCEYGSTTGRPRRCGWFDVPVVRYADRLNALTGIALPKLDVLSGLPRLHVCVAYEIDGVRREDVPLILSEFERAVPVYEQMEGWKEDLSDAREFGDR